MVSPLRVICRTLRPVRFSVKAFQLLVARATIDAYTRALGMVDRGCHVSNLSAVYRSLLIGSSPQHPVVWRQDTSSVAGPLKFTQYFETIRARPDRAMIRSDWIQQVVEHPVREVIQADGRIRRWAPVQEMQGRYLRVVLLADGETVHNAFFDRSFTR
jgi:hypothetical protein